MSESAKRHFTVEEKLEAVKAKLAGLAPEDVSSIFGCGTTSVSAWTRAYRERGIAGLKPAPHGRPPELGAKTQAAEQLIARIKAENPEAGISRTQGLIYRYGLLRLARETVRGILRRHGHRPQTQRTHRKNPPKKPRFFESAHPNDLWQTDIMTFMLRGMYRVYVIAFIDDHSRFIVGWGVYRLQTANNVIEVFRAAVEKHGMPKELLSDNGRQYYTWRGKSSFGKMLQKMGIKHLRSRPYHPQTLGKIESFWRNLLQECLEVKPVASFEEAQAAIQEYIEHYNHKRPHQGIGNVTPADRYFAVAEQVDQVVDENSRKVEAHEPPANYTPPTYIVGNIAGKELRVVAKEAEVSLREAEENKSAGGTNGADGADAKPADAAAGKPASAAAESPGAKAQGADGEAAKPAGEAGSGPAGADPGGDGGEALPPGGSVEGAVLPVAEAGPGGPAAGAGEPQAGAEAGGGQAGGCEPPQGPAQAPREGDGGAAPGAGPLPADDGGGAKGDPAQRLEPGAGQTNP